jgi:hypothetical protein
MTCNTIIDLHGSLKDGSRRRAMDERDQAGPPRPAEARDVERMINRKRRYPIAAYEAMPE